MAHRLFYTTRRGRKRLLCATLVSILLLGMLPMGALAAADSIGGYSAAPVSDSLLPKAGDSPWLAWALAIAAFTFGTYMQGKGKRVKKRKAQPKA